MKKFIELIRTKERDEKSVPNHKKSNVKEEKQHAGEHTESQPIEQPRDLFWDDYSDVGYC